VRASSRRQYRARSEVFRAKAIAEYWADPVKAAVRMKRYAQSDAGKAAKRRYAEKNADRIKARRAVSHAIVRGDLLRPEFCEDCFEKRHVQAHHHRGYDKEHWLDVVWLCQDCHDQEHHGHAA
jgi:hypothetical protein